LHRHHRLRDTGVLVLGIVMLAAITVGTGIGAVSSGAMPVSSFTPLSLDLPSDGPAGPVAGDVAGTAPGLSARTAPTRRPDALLSRSQVDEGDARGGLAAARPAPAMAPPVAGASIETEGGPVAASAASLSVPRPVAAFLGDSYTTGWAGAGLGAAGWPSIVAADRGWRVVNRSVAGTGFVNPGWTGQPVRTRVAAIVGANPGIVFVAAGHNDRRYGVRATARAADAVLRRLRRDLPDAVIVVIGPIWQDGSPPASILGIRTALRRSAASIDAIFIDPVGDGWFGGAAHRFILADGIHPSNAGHRRLAARVLTALESVR